MNEQTIKTQIMSTINQALNRHKNLAHSPKGIEVDIQPEWYSTLKEEPEIIYQYEKVGWNVRWMNVHSEGPCKGRLVRSWLTFWSGKYKKQETK
tara:strand:+ start:263 stop:544 length:282 start_codon:yes stop_codon:yes gene_type:complete